MIAAFMNEIFKLKDNDTLVPEKCNMNLQLPSWCQAIFGGKSLKVFGGKVWNRLLYHIKSSDNLEIFKIYLKVGTETCGNVMFVKNCIFVNCIVAEEEFFFSCKMKIDMGKVQIFKG